MKPTKILRVAMGTVLACAGGCWQSASAANGVNLIGSGTESTTMGGADVAVARDTSALNTNPAGLTQIGLAQLDQHFAYGSQLGFRHRDGFDNDVETSTPHPFLGDIGYAWRIDGRPIVMGVGLFAQAGAGGDFQNLNTAFGTRDDMSIKFAAAKLSAGGSYALDDKSSVGVSLGLVYATLDQTLFPETSFFASPTQSFFGLNLRDMRAISPSVRLGVRHLLSPSITLAAAYAPRTPLDFKDGQLVLNFSSIGLGKVNYRDATAKGLALPQQFDVGVAWRASPALLVAVELTRLDWSNAFDEGTLVAKNPDNPGAPAQVELVNELHWDDQTILAIGLAYDWSATTVLRLGYNYGRDPAPKNRINPFFVSANEHHLTGSVGVLVNHEWQVDTGIEYVLPFDDRYTNPTLPFGPDARVKGSFIGLHISATRRW